MMTNITYKLIAVLIICIVGLSACGLPQNGSQPSAATEAGSSSNDAVGTMVASTMQAITALAPSAEPVAVDTSVPTSGDLLPRSLYFINNDSAGIAQVYRLGKDGKSLAQITFEPVKVDSYDVSRVDGSVAYVSNNQLLLINADGSGRRVLLDAGAVDPNNPFITSVRLPVFSPDGKTIAYGFKGLNLYSLESGISNRVLEDSVDDLSGLLVLRQGYSPNKYSADGSKLLVTLHYYEGASSAIYYPAANTLVQLNGGEGALICCEEAEWAFDGSAVFSASASIGMFNPGLWRVDAATGDVTTLLSGTGESGTVYFAREPYLAPDGQLYFFVFSTPTDKAFDVFRAPLQLTRSNADGVTNIANLRPETFQRMNEALWAPDASFVIIANAPSEDIYFGGVLELYYTDGSKTMISLLPYGQNLKWGN